MSVIYEQLDVVKEKQISWLLEVDEENPAVRYFSLLDLFDRSQDDAELRQAKAQIAASGAVPAILGRQHPEGYWGKPGNGYSPKYTGTIWQVILLAELGADPTDARVQRACEYVLRHSRAATGAFSFNRPPVPSGAAHCLNGNLLYALLKLGYADDARLREVLNWLVQTITGQGEHLYYKSGACAPCFACGINGAQPCGWGAVKALKALSAVPKSLHTPLLQQAIQTGVEFLFSRNPAAADYPYTQRVSSTWFKFGFPLSYWSDVLETSSVLVDLGYGQDARLADAIQFILNKRSAQGYWMLENSLNGKMWVDIEKKGKPSKWVTLRALRVIKKVSPRYY